MRPSLYVAALAVSLWANGVGCGGDSGEGDTADDLTQDELDALCADSCDQFVECGWGTDGPSCQAECSEGTTLLRDDALKLQLECLANLACSTDNPGETCYVETASELAPHAAHEQYEADCTAAEAECGDLPGDVCAVHEVILFNDSYMEAEILPCFDLACDALSLCLEDKVLDAL